MRIKVIPDIHGKTDWKDIIDHGEHDEVIFLGDYQDSFDFKDTHGYTKEWVYDYNERVAEEQVTNLREILSTDSIKLLGNHDYHYTDYNTHPYSGYQTALHKRLMKTFNELIDNREIKLCHQITINDQVYLFSHAGVSVEWLTRAKIDYSDLSKLAFNINTAFYKDPSIVEFGAFMPDETIALRYDSSGDDTWQSPIWIRPQSLGLQMIPNVIQIIGHTRVKEIAPFIQEGTGIILTDVLDRMTQYLLIDDEGHHIMNYSN